MSDAILLALLLIGILAYLFAGLTPFTFDFGRELHVHFGLHAPVNNLLNFVCFVPLGMVLAKLSFVERPVLTAALVCGALSFTVETLQLFIPGRFSSVTDLLLNTGGAAAGAYLAGASLTSEV